MAKSNKADVSSGPVYLIVPDGSDQITIKNAGEHLAFYWAHVVKSRGRWRSDDRARKALVEDARSRLKERGLDDNVLHRIAKARRVEISIPADDSQWASRILPWEFLLRELTRPFRDGGLTVIRHLRVPARTNRRKSSPSHTLYVENNPAPFSDQFSYEGEQRLVRHQLGLSTEPLSNPTAAELKNKVAKLHPSVIHLAGVDHHQARELSANTQKHDQSGSERLDGLVMVAERPAAEQVWEPVDEQVLAAALTNDGKESPLLVAFNIYNSAARLAPAAVSRGAEAAVGFYDTVDDAAAEKFYAALYRSLHSNGWRIGAAFETALQEVSAGGGMRGSYAVLWTGKSVIEELGRPTPPRASRGGKAKRVTAPPSERLIVTADAVDRVNYARLQANEPIFRRFNISRNDSEPISDIKVEVVLFVGPETFPFEKRYSMKADEAVIDLKREIQLPLLSAVQRSLREGARTLLRYTVFHGKKEVDSKSLPVHLCAVNEWWWDLNDDARYLASFVLPGDRAVLQIVDAAQKYLQVLRDDYSAGFDGFQSFDKQAGEPSWAIDAQAQALWSTLSFETPLHYINPPPTFLEGTQRLRTPSDVIKGRRGTCIDLALLYAACLEFVEIYPVIFVLKDHAFPGYWRSEADWEAYARVSDGGRARAGWSEFDEVKNYVKKGRLVALETTLLTSHSGFQEAMDGTEKHFDNESNWGGLLDLKIARSRGATPVPLID